MKFLYVIVIGGLLLPPLANSEESFGGSGIKGKNYLGVMVSSPQYKEDDSNSSFRSAGLIARGGREFSRFFALEGQAGVFGEDIVGNNSYQIDYLVGFYPRLNLPLAGSRIRLYALSGITYFSGNVPGFSSVDETAIAYGAGIELYGDEYTAMTIEWMRYADGDVKDVNYVLESASLGFVHRF